MCGRYYIPEEDSAEELRAIIDEVNRKNKGAPIIYCLGQKNMVEYSKTHEDAAKWQRRK